MGVKPPEARFGLPQSVLQQQREQRQAGLTALQSIEKSRQEQLANRQKIIDYNNALAEYNRQLELQKQYQKIGTTRPEFTQFLPQNQKEYYENLETQRLALIAYGKETGIKPVFIDRYTLTGFEDTNRGISVGVNQIQDYIAKNYSVTPTTISTVTPTTTSFTPTNLNLQQQAALSDLNKTVVEHLQSIGYQPNQVEKGRELIINRLLGFKTLQDYTPEQIKASPFLTGRQTFETYVPFYPKNVSEALTLGLIPFGFQALGELGIVGKVGEKIVSGAFTYLGIKTLINPEATIKEKIEGGIMAGLGGISLIKSLKEIPLAEMGRGEILRIGEKSYRVTPEDFLKIGEAKEFPTLARIPDIRPFLQDLQRGEILRIESKGGESFRSFIINPKDLIKIEPPSLPQIIKFNPPQKIEVSTTGIFKPTIQPASNEQVLAALKEASRIMVEPTNIGEYGGVFKPTLDISDKTIIESLKQLRDERLARGITINFDEQAKIQNKIDLELQARKIVVEKLIGEGKSLSAFNKEDLIYLKNQIRFRLENLAEQKQTPSFREFTLQQLEQARKPIVLEIEKERNVAKFRTAKDIFKSESELPKDFQSIETKGTQQLLLQKPLQELKPLEQIKQKTIVKQELIQEPKQSEYYGKGLYERTQTLSEIQNPPIEKTLSKGGIFSELEGIGAKNIFSDLESLSQIDKQQSKQQLNLAQLQIEKQSQVQNQSLNQNQLFSQKQNSAQLQNQAQIQLQLFAQAQPQLQLQSQLEKENLRYIQELVEEKGKELFITFISIKKRKQELKPSGKAYNIYVKEPKQKQFNKIPNKNLVKKDAENLGSYVVDNSTARSFYIKPVKAKPQRLGLDIPENNFENTRYKFRDYKIKQGKKVEFIGHIEKTPYLIDTEGEKRQLSAFRELSELKQKGGNTNFISSVMKL